MSKFWNIQKYGGVKIMHLANNEHKFYLKVKGDKTGEPFEGDFNVKCILTNEEQVEVAIRVDRYNGGSTTISQAHALINRTVAELELRIKRDEKGKLLAPTWWVDSDFGRTLYDTNVLYSVFEKAMEGEKKWDERIRKLADKTEEDLKKSEQKEAEDKKEAADPKDGTTTYLK